MRVLVAPPADTARSQRSPGDCGANLTADPESPTPTRGGPSPACGWRSGFGPHDQGPRELMEAACDAIKDHLKDDYPDLHVTVEGPRRAVLVRFGDPVTPGQPDFTSDVIVALDHPSGRGLFIPNLEIDAEWDHADPETHTRLVLEAIEQTEVTFARLIRLLKHWRDRHSEPMCSWNIKALALECITEPMQLLRALQVFFTHAADSIAKELTDDPAGVAGKIALNMSRAAAAHRLRVARDHINEAIRHENAGRPASAQHALHKVLPAVIPDSDTVDQTLEAAPAVTVGSATTITGPGRREALVRSYRRLVGTPRTRRPTYVRAGPNTPLRVRPAHLPPAGSRRPRRSAPHRPNHPLLR